MAKSSGNRSGGNRGGKGINRAGGKVRVLQVGRVKPENLLVAVEITLHLRRENND